MASTISKNQPPKARKRIDVGLPANLKRGSNGSAFTRCDSCNKDIPAATVDMHDCIQDAKTSSVLATPVQIAVDEAVSAKGKTKAQNTKTQKRKSASGAADKATKPKKVKKEKDPNEPKRPPTAFFLFMDEFRKTYKEANPNVKGATAVSKEGGDKWKSMSDEDKARFVRKSADMKEEYEKAVKTYKSNGKESLESTITDNGDEKCDGAEESSEENAASTENADEAEQ